MVNLWRKRRSHDGRNCKVTLLSIVKQLEDIVADDNSDLPAKNFLSTHDCGFAVV